MRIHVTRYDAHLSDHDDEEVWDVPGSITRRRGCEKGRDADPVATAPA